MRDERGNAAIGCLMFIALCLLFGVLGASCIEGNPNDDGDDSNDCYYTEPIPHYDECY